MKRIIKIIGIILFICLAICQTNSSVFAYTQEQIKEIVEYKEFDVSEEPDEYDLKIEGSNMVENISIPVIQTSFEMILFGSSVYKKIDAKVLENLDILDINFFDSKSQNTNKSWQFIRDFTKAGFKYCLYISYAIMLTLLIYVGIVVVNSARSGKNIDINLPKIPFFRKKNTKEYDARRSIERKRFIEYWVTTIIFLAISIFIITLIINFSMILEQTIKPKKENDSRIVYIRNATRSGSAQTASGGSTDIVTYASQWVGKIPYKSSVTGDDPNNERFEPLQEGRGSDCSWFVFHVLEYCGYLTEFVHSYEWGSNPELYPNGTSIGTDINNAQPGDILCYGYGRPRSGSNSHVAIYIGNGETVECCAGQGVINGKVNEGSLIDIVRFGGAKASNTTTYTTNSSNPNYSYTFKTNTEGILMVQSQHDWKRFALQNFIFIFKGLIVTASKYIIYFFFIIRMIGIAVIIIITPIIIMINYFGTIYGKKEIITSLLLKPYTFLVISKPIICLVYYVLRYTIFK